MTKASTHLVDPVRVYHLMAQLQHLRAVAARRDSGHLIRQLPDQCKRALLHVGASGTCTSKRERRHVLCANSCDQRVRAALEHLEQRRDEVKGVRHDGERVEGALPGTRAACGRRRGQR